MELLYVCLIVFGFRIDTLILQLVDLNLTQRHHVDILIRIRQVSQRSADGDSGGQC